MTTALASEVPVNTPDEDFDEALWQAWSSLDLPEGYRAEIIEGTIEVSPAGSVDHGEVINNVRDALAPHLADTGFRVRNDMNIRHDGGLWIPDLFVAPRNVSAYRTKGGAALLAECVELVVEVVSPGHDGISRDRTRKRRGYARAGIPVYVIIDGHDEGGVVSILTDPKPTEGLYTDEMRIPFGTDAVIPQGPAKGFAITESLTSPTE